MGSRVTTSEVIEKHGHRAIIRTERDNRRGKEYFMVEWRGIEKRERKKFGAYERARRHAESVVAILCAGQPTLDKADPTALALFHHYRQILGDAGVIHALQKYSKTVAQTAINTPEAVETYLASQTNRSPRHLQTIRSHLKRFAKAFPKPLSDITPHDIDKYVNSRSPSPKTRLNHRTSILALFNFAKRKHWLDPDRDTAAKLSERPKVPPSEPEIFTPEEMRKLLQAAPANIVPALAIGAFCGARNAEICRLTWAEWNPVEGILVFPTAITKTRRRRTARVPDNLAAWLNQHVGKPDEKIMPYVNYTRAFSEVARMAGVRWKHNALRHSFASYHLELHENPSLTAKLCGHSIRELETHYTKLTTRTVAEQWFTIAPTKNDQPCPDN